MNHVEFDATCPHCGLSMDVVNQAHPTSHESVLIVWCPKCRNEHAIVVRLIALQGRRATPARDRVKVPA